MFVATTSASLPHKMGPSNRLSIVHWKALGESSLFSHKLNLSGGGGGGGGGGV